MQPIQETIYYQDASPVLITSSKAILLDKTFAIRNIVSVSMKKNDSNYYLDYLLIAAGLVLLWFGITTDLSQPAKVGLFIGAGLVSLITGFVIFIISATKPKYYLVIGVATGQIKAACSKDPAYITNLVNVLSAAISYAPVY